MIAVDTSVVVAAFATWHESHRMAARIVTEHPRLPAPVALEAYAVLTRLPPPHRAEGAIASGFLAAAFPDGSLSHPAAAGPRLVAELAELEIVGGASYDAVIAMIAREHGCELVTLDRRAHATYERVGAKVRQLA